MTAIIRALRSAWRWLFSELYAPEIEQRPSDAPHVPRPLGAHYPAPPSAPPPPPPDRRIDSTSDDGTANNLMRHKYRVLSADEKCHMQAVKDKGLELVELLHDVGGTRAEYNEEPGEHVRQASRELSIAQTKIEEAVMWAVKHVTR